MAPNSPADDTQSIHPASDPREIARQNLQRPSEAVARPERIGPYKILETLGEGGMGIVYLAEQTKPIHRRVALKIIKLGMDTKQVMARFETEREALALMNHPNVAKVLDAGATETGRPYFVMEYVAGIPITEYCDKHRLNTEERLRLFMDVCNAIQHAHQKGIIHRDIKPSNVLVSVDQTAPPLAKGEPGGVAVKVIDFGIAKATQQRLSEMTFSTQEGQFIGTPAYMSPEQAEMTALDIDTRTDIYSLGVLLYELLVGERPFDEKMLREAGLAEIQRMIREVDPPKPSTRLSALGSVPRVSTSGSVTPGDPKSPLPHGHGSSIDDIAHRRHTEPKTLIRQIRGDLDWIVMRAMEKDRTRRYDTANGLSMEIHRYLNNEPVLAGPPTARYRIGKFVRRNKGAVAAVAAVLLALATGLSVAVGMYVRAEHARAETAAERDRAEEAERLTQESLIETKTARDEAEAVNEFLEGMLAAARPIERGKDVTVREVIDAAVEQMAETPKLKRLVLARLRFTIGTTYYYLGVYTQAEFHLSLAHKLFLRELGADHETTLRSLNNLATVLLEQGKFREAEEALLSILETYRKKYGENHSKSFSAAHNLAIAFARAGKLVEAEQLNRELLTLRTKALGLKAFGTLASMHNLAVTLAEMGKLAEAEDLFRKDLNGMRERWGAQDPETARSMHNLALVLARQGRLREAEELYESALNTRRTQLGEVHSDTLESVVGTAALRTRQGRLADAEKLYREALFVARRALGPDHPFTLDTLTGLAEALGRVDIQVIQQKRAAS